MHNFKVRLAARIWLSTVTWHVWWSVGRLKPANLEWYPWTLDDFGFGMATFCTIDTV